MKANAYRTFHVCHDLIFYTSQIYNHPNRLFCFYIHIIWVITVRHLSAENRSATLILAKHLPRMLQILDFPNPTSNDNCTIRKHVLI